MTTTQSMSYYTDAQLVAMVRDLWVAADLGRGDAAYRVAAAGAVLQERHPRLAQEMTEWSGILENRQGYPGTLIRAIDYLALGGYHIGSEQ